jgi:hypothetical protein
VAGYAEVTVPSTSIAASTGVSTVIEPATAGDYMVDMAGNFHASGKLACDVFASSGKGKSGMLSSSASSIGPAFNGASASPLRFQNIGGTGALFASPSRPIIQVCSGSKAATSALDQLTAKQVSTVNGKSELADHRVIPAQRFDRKRPLQMAGALKKQ